MRSVKCLYDHLRGIHTYHKDWEDKRKGNMERRKKGTKPPFFINTTQGKKNSKEPRMTEAMETRPRQQPMKCWGCDGNHMFRYCLQRGEKMRTEHSVWQVVIVEDMGRSVPRIYAALDNNQDEF